jgi:membrane-associated phospholipid phosphatase
MTTNIFKLMLDFIIGVFIVAFIVIFIVAALTLDYKLLLLLTVICWTYASLPSRQPRPPRRSWLGSVISRNRLRDRVAEALVIAINRTPGISLFRLHLAISQLTLRELQTILRRLVSTKRIRQQGDSYFPA